IQRLLDDITHLYDQTLGSLEVERKPVALHSWLGNVLGPWREAARDQRLSWHVDLPDDLPVVEIDSDRLAQALENVTSNAVKYTPSGGTVTVTAGMDAGQVWIRVSDNGPGITSEEQERILTPFYRGSAGKRFPQGMGLGLSIARDLVAAHNGRIELESAPGTGSVFTICIPRN
ncbi:MAG: HAMP domain-containing histidine kinase, partial [Anaerolineae bacterium]|nr:HAMP domain-containing histidine kinase [Anaerolineae bacterium]